MSERLEGKIALVTGGSSGIGAAIAERMVEEGAVVIAADLAADATELASERLAPLRMDVADPDSVGAAVAAIVARHGRLDCLVNSAGIGKDIPFLDTSLETFDRIIAVNLRGTFIVGQAAARIMRQAGGGAIVNVASVSGMIGNVGRAAYGASKGGVILLSQVMAVDLAADGIRVNVLAPGPADTPMVTQMHDAAIRARWTQRIPMGRYARPDELASAAVFLASDEASFITGHVLAVDGGFMGSGLAKER